ncbi:hypothetical protein [Bradyrhizobium sp. URHC0002]
MTAETLAPSQFDFAALCASRAPLIADGSLLVCEYGDEMQAIAEHTGLIAAIGQDAVQDIMGEAIAMAHLVPEPDANELAELAEALEIEIALRAAEMLREWELADPRDRWRHTGEPRPQARPVVRQCEPYAPAQSTVDAFWHVHRLENPDCLARWLANHPADAPALYEIWKASRC